MSVMKRFDSISLFSSACYFLTYIFFTIDKYSDDYTSWLNTDAIIAFLLIFLLLPIGFFMKIGFSTSDNINRIQKSVLSIYFMLVLTQLIMYYIDKDYKKDIEGFRIFILILLIIASLIYIVEASIDVYKSGQNLNENSLNIIIQNLNNFKFDALKGYKITKDNVSKLTPLQLRKIIYNNESLSGNDILKQYNLYDKQTTSLMLSSTLEAFYITLFSEVCVDRNGEMNKETSNVAFPIVECVLCVILAGLFTSSGILAWN